MRISRLRRSWARRAARRASLPVLLDPVRGDQAFAGYIRVDGVLDELQPVVVRVGLEVDGSERGLLPPAG